MEFKNYRKYKWFYTSSGKLVVGGKSAAQNDELLKRIEKSDKEYVVMHTASPGSPFSVIISETKKVTKKDFEECAIFTGCFSRAWKQGKKKVEIHIFSSNQLEKKKGMKTGTWAVIGKIGKTKIDLSLVLTKQKRVYRAVPKNSVKKKEILLVICPGKTDKSKMSDQILEKLGEKKNKKDEILGALPAGGVRIC